MDQEEMGKGIIRLTCPDQPGVIASVSQFLYGKNADIAKVDQFSTDYHNGTIFARFEFNLDGLSDKLNLLKADFTDIAQKFTMNWDIRDASRRKKLAIFVSKEDHCLQDLLIRWRTGELKADISMIVSNHNDMRGIAESFGILYHHVPVTKATLHEAEEKHLQLLEGKADAVVLARYMQIIPSKMIERYQNRIINIHHSFLPAFIGGKPYQQAFDRGVKLIGATAHFVTQDLDEGPIIEQDVSRVDHRHQVSDLKRIGRDLERIVLAKGIRYYLNDKVFVNGNKTVVFH
ncbi:formyltetrahydrofolate deformylase [Scopulibacillus darangshiensis]|uniref:Formyltetrahydrofolate deformylase n=1 Tax=Scopulibacillus darangshiensis TaxID=442528 RepID=A0A4R2NKR4_9BACL|nr:formyltetrahydrofolate deformylase [Scopulibacillus darangshiensis]TCP21928.1 formyltetrahydrofolate deformylase [Scopulibacillus darangshiensis]